MALNRVVLIGRLTRDPEISYSPQGVAVAKFSLAVDRNTARDEQGNRETDFIPCVCFRQSAEFVGEYLKKGRLASVDGRIQVRKYQTQQGENRTFTEVVADRVEGLDRPRQDGEQPAADLGGEDPFAGG